MLFKSPLKSLILYVISLLLLKKYSQAFFYPLLGFWLPSYPYIKCTCINITNRFSCWCLWSWFFCSMPTCMKHEWNFEIVCSLVACKITAKIDWRIKYSPMIIVLKSGWNFMFQFWHKYVILAPSVWHMLGDRWGWQHKQETMEKNHLPLSITRGRVWIAIVQIKLEECFHAYSCYKSKLFYF